RGRADGAEPRVAGVVVRERRDRPGRRRAVEQVRVAGRSDRCAVSARGRVRPVPLADRGAEREAEKLRAAHGDAEDRQPGEERDRAASDARSYGEAGNGTAASSTVSSRWGGVRHVVARTVPRPSAW